MVVIIFMMLICRLTPAIPALSFLQLPVDIIRWAGILWIAVITAWSGIDYFVRNFDCIRNAK